MCVACVSPSFASLALSLRGFPWVKEIPFYNRRVLYNRRVVVCSTHRCARLHAQHHGQRLYGGEREEDEEEVVDVRCAREVWGRKRGARCGALWFGTKGGSASVKLTQALLHMTHALLQDRVIRRTLERGRGGTLRERSV